MGAIEMIAEQDPKSNKFVPIEELERGVFGTDSTKNLSSSVGTQIEHITSLTKQYPFHYSEDSKFIACDFKKDIEIPGLYHLSLLVYHSNNGEKTRGQSYKFNIKIAPSYAIVPRTDDPDTRVLSGFRLEYIDKTGGSGKAIYGDRSGKPINTFLYMSKALHEPTINHQQIIQLMKQFILYTE